MDPIAAEDNIRLAAIHPWFAGKGHPPLTPPTRANVCHVSEFKFLKKNEDTSILGLPEKIFLAGLPLTPVPRIAGAVFRAATDPDIATSGCPWVLPDDGPVIRVEKEALRTGVYDAISRRMLRAFR
jgi:hypothetical protein